MNPILAIWNPRPALRRGGSPARPRQGRRLAALAALLLSAAFIHAASAAAVETRPEPILSWRIRILPEERYKELRDEWKTWAEAHPRDPLGWTQLAKAARYAGDGCKAASGYARRALEVDPGYADAHAALAYIGADLYCPDGGLSMREAARELERALALDPANAEPNFTLWVMRVHLGDARGADDCLRALIDGGQFPEPVLDFGYNLLIGLERDAILITNGDNDTYPPLALQAGRRVRPDVAVVNLALLNARWYRESLRNGPHHLPVPILGDSIPMPQSGPAVAGLIDALASEGWMRPLYVAITVPDWNLKLTRPLSLEGVVQRVLPSPAGAPQVDVARFTANLEGAYRMDSITSLGFDWEGSNSVRKLIGNYASLLVRLADAHVESGRRTEAGAAMDRAARLAEFHHDRALGRSVVDRWLQWDTSEQAKRWQKAFAE